MTDAAEVAQQVLEADGQPFITLSLAPSLGPVTVDTSVADARRNYMRLAGLIHPDRIRGSFAKATEAFQCLVRAFECFADPKARKQAAGKVARQQQQRQRRQRKGSEGKLVAVPRPTKGLSEAKAGGESASPTEMVSLSRNQPRRTTRRGEGKAPGSDEDEKDKKATSTDTDDDDGNVSEDSYSGFLSDDREPPVSTSRTPIGKPRTGGLYAETTVGCPHCRTRWEPDSKPQYSLFMGPWGKRVHCQLCLFMFGAATALHGCPHCTAPFAYDSSMYEETVECQRCRRSFACAYFPVSQYLIDQISLERWRERREGERAKEREARAKARHGATEEDAAAERLAILVGTCIMEGRCDLCHQQVKSKHRSHVEKCMGRGPEGVEIIVGEERAAGRACASSRSPVSPKAKSAVRPSAKKAAAKPAKRANPPSPAKLPSLPLTKKAVAPLVPAKMSPTQRRKAPAVKKAGAGRGSTGKRRRRSPSPSSSEDDEVSDDDDESSYGSNSGDSDDGDYSSDDE